MNEDQQSKQILANAETLAALKESLKSAHRRIDENDRITEGIHKIAANMEALTLQVKLQGERFDAWTNKTEQKIGGHNDRITTLEHKPAKRWEAVVGQMIGLTVAAVMGMLLAKLGG